MPPLIIFPENIGVTYDDEAMLGTSDGYVNTFLVLEEGSFTGAYHGDKNEVKLSALRAVDREHLVLGFIFSEILCDCVFLTVVRRDNVDVVLCEFLNRDVFIHLVFLDRVCELL